MIRNVEILGQAVNGISEDMPALEPAIPWRKIAGMRDKPIHEHCEEGTYSFSEHRSGTCSYHGGWPNG